MIGANNPDIDVAALERRIEIELKQPETPVSASLIASTGILAPRHGSGLRELKRRMREIPVLGTLLARINRWQRQRRVVARLLASPYIGYALRWLKSLALAHETRARVEMADVRLAELRQELAELRQEAGFIEQRLRTEIGLSNAHLAELRTLIDLGEQRLADLRLEVGEEKKSIAANRTEILFQQRRLTGLLENAPASIASGQRVVEAVKIHSDALDNYYAAFEAAFRGGREEIKRRMRVYLDRAAAAPSALPVLDIGCGRGEWIELLGERGISAYGVDLNSVFVADARANNLDVREEEALAHLRGLKEASLAGVTGFHIIEHLDLHDLIDIIDEANRVLAPGGFALFETPNPENLIVGASSFWNDPSHRAPLPPSVSRFMIEQRGFIDAEVIYLHAADNALRLAGTDETSIRLNQLLYGPQDYAIWARKA